MYLHHLSVTNYRNIGQVDAEFSPSLNLFLGRNGMGKTNLLDAIYYLSFCKSHTHTPDPQLLRQGESLFLLQGSYQLEQRREEILCAFQHNGKKTFKRNKKDYERLSQHIGLLPLVIVSPQDTELIHGQSEARRRFIDILISQYDNSYLQALIRYNRALLQRNTLLRSQVSNHDLYEALEAALSSEAAVLYGGRERFIRQLTPLFERYYTHISDSSETVELRYISHLHTSEPLSLLLHHRPTDLRLGYTGYGIHRDDLHFSLRHQLLRHAGSQGQHKTALLALKLAQHSLLAQHSHSLPILLLDDIFDKLDATRVRQIIGLVSSQDFGQIFITDSHRHPLPLADSSRVASFHLVDGGIGRLEG
jgi:DNA replication and repair protein RecF